MVRLRSGCRKLSFGDLFCRSQRMRIAGERKEWAGIPIRAVNVASGRYAEVRIRKKRSFNRFSIRLLALFCDPAGARTQDPILKRDVLYLLSY